MRDYTKGMLLVATGVLVLSPDALLIKMIDAGPWTILFWRGLLFFLFQAAIVLWRYGTEAVAVLRATGRLGGLAIVIMSCTQTLFVLSIENTHAANTLVIIAAAPLGASVMAWLFLNEPPARRTVITGLIGLVAVGLTVRGGVEIGGTAGDLAALGVVLALSTFFVVLRMAKDRDMLPALAFGGLLVAVIALLNSPPLTVAPSDVVPLLLLCLVVAPLAFLLISIGPRYLPAPEVNLLMLLETVLGPVWVWLVLNEVPTSQTIIGGLLLLSALATNTWLAMRRG